MGWTLKNKSLEPLLIKQIRMPSPDSFKAYLAGLSRMQPSLTIGLEDLAAGIGVPEDSLLRFLSLLHSEGELLGLTTDNGLLTIDLPCEVQRAR